ncbi:MAG: phenylalanine--tRNA ligase subunit beta [Phycisphaeraceae bacterium]|nr:MAG: phenylalanine--tRNA ligase subunit beta [Phycisphaeraceae bacterium]
MDISLDWLNQYLSPADATAQEADDLLTQAGLPIESRTALPGGDVLLDVEVTSNRPDCLSHIGCAREVAALSGRELVYPEPSEPARAGPVSDLLTLENRDHAACPLFTAHVLTGCKVGPSPSWLVERLEAIGQRSINNAVDITNFITMELGNPCHVFDRNKLAGHKLVIRFAEEGEKLRTLDDKQRVLKEADLVVADAERAQSLAGVMGGGDSEVDESTTDVVFEMATWDPVTVRTQARRLAINTDAGFRFQRGVDPRTIDFAARRAIALLVELTGGQLAEGVLSEGAPLPGPQIVTMRPSRVETILGIEIPVGDMISMLRAVEVGVEQAGEDELRCEIPPHRARDLTREIDLIEEVARITGYDAIPIAESMSVKIDAPQPERRARRELVRVLTGLGFDETVTFSFTSPRHAELFVAPGLEAAAVDDARRADEPTLRPSGLLGLLGCRRANQSARSAAPGMVRLFEVTSTFAQHPAAGDETVPPESVERRNVCLLMDAPGSGETTRRSHDDLQQGLRVMRGAIDTVVRAMHGSEAEVTVEPHAGCPIPAWDANATAWVGVRGPGASKAVTIGLFGLLSDAALKAFDIDTPVVAAELGLDSLVAGYPPRSLAHALPQFPHIERDLSLVLDESVRWSTVSAMVNGLGLDRLESCGFVGTFRGKQVGPGKKSVTLRLRFRDPDRTLRHEEVDPQVESVVLQSKQALGAELRG